MEDNILLRKLGDWIKIIQRAILFMILLEAVLVIIIGIASNNIVEDVNIWLAILIACSILYFFIIIFRFAYETKFPTSIVNELLSRNELVRKNKLLLRQQSINEFITTSIQGLNSQTCSISLVFEDLTLCDKELEISLVELINPLIINTHIVFDLPVQTRFSIGIYIEDYKKFPDDYSLLEVGEYDVSENCEDMISDNGILILRDELNFSETITKDLVHSTKPIGTAFEIKTGITRAQNNLAFDIHKFKVGEKTFNIVSSGIADACSESSSSGVLFFIFPAYENIPEDIEHILRIFNRVIANYMSNYNSCMTQRILREKKRQSS